MDEKTLFLKHWEKEATATRKVLSRIPQERSDYRPDPRSRNARELAWLIVREEKLLVEGLENGELVWVEPPPPATVHEILAQYDREHGAVTKRLHELPLAKWEQKIPFVVQGQAVMSESGFHFAWDFLFDQVHHRGQLSTYLRPMGATVPSIYGPSADEQF